MVQEMGICGICGKECQSISRQYYYYHINCECCGSGKHFEFIYHCNDCKPKPPKEIKLRATPKKSRNKELFGVILARFQPIHLGHLSLIEKACAENDKVVLLVGSADKFNIRNPIPIEVRIDLLTNALIEKGLIDQCIIKPLNDLSDESDNSLDWGMYLYANIVDIIKESSFNIYYSDGFEIITTWFPKFMLKNYISMSLMARNQVNDGISATKVREAILNDKDLNNLVPKNVLNKKDLIKTFLKISKKNV